MTIKLLTPRDLTIGGRTVTYPAGALVTLDAATETGLIASKEATATLTGGITYTPPVPSGQPQPLYAIPSDQGVGNIIPMVGGKYAPTQADLLRLFPLPTHRVIADPWTVNIAGASKPAGATITVEADANEYGGSVIRIDLPAGVVSGAITLPINPDITGAYPKALPETAWRMNISDWSAVSRLYGKLGDANLANSYLWVIIDDSSGGKSQYGCYLGGVYPAKWNNVYRTLRANPFTQVTKVGALPWDENSPEAEIRAVGFTVSTTAATTIRLSRVYSPEWNRGAIVHISDGGYQSFHDNALPYFAARGWPGVVSRLATTEAGFTKDEQWSDFVAAGWDICQHIAQGGSQSNASTTPAQIEQALNDFKRLAQTLKINNAGNYLFSQFLGNAGRYAGADMAGLLRAHGIQSSRGMCSDAEYGIDTWDAKFTTTGSLDPHPHGFVPKHGRYNRWQYATGDDATPELRDNYAASRTKRQVAITAAAKSVGIIYSHRVLPYDGTNPLTGNVGLNFYRDFIADCDNFFAAGKLIPLSITQLDGLTYNRPGDVFTRWDGEWVSRTTGKIVI